MFEKIPDRQLHDLVEKTNVDSLAVVRDPDDKDLLVFSKDNRDGLLFYHASFSSKDVDLDESEYMSVLQRIAPSISTELWQLAQATFVEGVSHYYIPESILKQSWKQVNLLAGFDAESRASIEGDVRYIVSRILSPMSENAIELIVKDCLSKIKPFTALQFSLTYPRYVIHVIILFVLLVFGVATSVYASGNLPALSIGIILVGIAVWRILTRILSLKKIGSLYKMRGRWKRGTILIPKSCGRMEVAKYVTHETMHYLKDFGYIKRDAVATAVSIIRMLELGLVDPKELEERNPMFRRGMELAQMAIEGRISWDDVERIAIEEAKKATKASKEREVDRWFE